ncbi:MAG: GNAT family N-acetyltransferase [bacterium]
MEFKEVKLDRLAEVVDVNLKIFDGMYDWPPYYIEKYQERFKDTQPVIFVAEKDGKIVADSIAFDRGGKWYVWILGVLEEYRKQGIATELFNLTENYARGHGYKIVSIKVYNVSQDMLKLTQNRGYNIVEVRKYKDPEKPKYDANILELAI